MEEKKNHIGKDKKENKENNKQVKSISQRDLAKELALKFGMNISVIEGIIEEEQKLTMLYVAKGYKITKKNYITIKPILTKPRTMVCPINKQVYEIPAMRRVVITAGMGFKSVVNKNKKMPDKMCRFVEQKSSNS